MRGSPMSAPCSPAVRKMWATAGASRRSSQLSLEEHADSSEPLEGARGCAPSPPQSQPPHQVRAPQDSSRAAPRRLRHSPALTPEPGNADLPPSTRAPPRRPPLLPASKNTAPAPRPAPSRDGPVGLHQPLSQHGNPAKPAAASLGESRCSRWFRARQGWGSCTGRGAEGLGGETLLEFCNLMEYLSLCSDKPSLRSGWFPPEPRAWTPALPEPCELTLRKHSPPTAEDQGDFFLSS